MSVSIPRARARPAPRVRPMAGPRINCVAPGSPTRTRSSKEIERFSRLIRTGKSSALAAALIATVALAGPAWAFPQPKYPATLPAAAPSQTPGPTAAPARARPAAEKPAAPSGSWSVYVVQRGDTLTGVGRRFGQTLRTLTDLNELDPKVPLRAGVRIKLPPGAADSGKDPYASGPTPFALGETARAATPETSRPQTPKPETPRPETPKSSRVTEAALEPAPTSAPATPAPGDLPAERPPAREASQAQVQAQVQAQPEAPAAASSSQEQKPVQAEAAVSDAAAAGRGRFVWPIRGQIVMGFGPLAQGQRNDGINIAADRGADVKAAADGVVVYAGSEVKGYGNTVLIMHPGGWDTVYTHLDKIEVGNRGFHVKQGEVIGTVGSTGDVDQPQLHFETRFSADARHKYNPIDPLSVLPQ